MRHIAIGDIHGCLGSLKKLLFENIALQANDSLYFLGDYLDRGPDSKGVIDLIWQLAKQQSVICLRGNHEQLTIDAFYRTAPYENWKRQGGKETLSSFGVQYAKDLPIEYIKYFESLPYYAVYENYFLVHGGFNFNLENILEDEHAMMWARNYQVDPAKTGKKIVVHGHTPISLSEILKQDYVKNFEINLDGGCVYPHKEGQGHLVAFDMSQEKYYYQAYSEF